MNGYRGVENRLQQSFCTVYRSIEKALFCA
jgi:hypothetical protein